MGQDALFRMADPHHQTMHDLQRITHLQRRAALEPSPEDWRTRLPVMIRGHRAGADGDGNPTDWSPLLAAALQPMQTEAIRALSEAELEPELEAELELELFGPVPCSSYCPTERCSAPRCQCTFTGHRPTCE